ncbi:MAG: SUMF1/EgtB/PvdO family nonheme iron enzyme [Planctomycetes bacterium]|nr:SUMF1/EgtB/PvdO family nonheme iron enzyme [Planctomycetota bacterium]
MQIRPPGLWKHYPGEGTAGVHSGFFIGKYEVTWAQYRRFCEATGRAPPSNVIACKGDWVTGQPGPSCRCRRFEAEDDHPVFGVSFEEAAAYCAWAGGRLPTALEWETAAGADGREYPWGAAAPDGTRLNAADESNAGECSDHRVRINPGLAPWDDGFGCTAPVTSLPLGASPYGCHHMSGNVAEWVVAVPEVLGDAKLQPGQHLYLGGSWASHHGHCRIGLRRPTTSALPRTTTIGFRLCRSAR